MNTASSAVPLAVLKNSLAGRASVTAILMTFFLGLAWADANGLAGARPAWWLLPVAVVLAVGGTSEMVRLFSAHDVILSAWLLCPAVVAVVVSVVLGVQFSTSFPGPSSPAAMGWPLVVQIFVIGFIFIIEIVSYRAHTRAIERIGAAAIIVGVIGLPLAFMVGLRLLDLENIDATALKRGRLGIVPLLSLVAVVKAGDVAAYGVGSLCGRCRLVPTLSPGKTWEGAVASLSGAILVAWLVLEGLGIELPSRPWGGWLVFGIAVGLAGLLGDLAESLFKREMRAKDSGRSLGGLGGVLDLIDSLLFAAPVAWLLWTLGNA